MLGRECLALASTAGQKGDAYLQRSLFALFAFSKSVGCLWGIGIILILVTFLVCVFSVLHPSLSCCKETHGNTFQGSM